MFFSPKEKISHIYQKIINLWNAKTFHNHLDKPIFHPNKKFLILTQRKSCKRKKFWHPPERTNFLLKLKNLLYLAEKVTNFLYLPEKKKKFQITQIVQLLKCLLRPAVYQMSIKSQHSQVSLQKNQRVRQTFFNDFLLRN